MEKLIGILTDIAQLGLDGFGDPGEIPSVWVMKKLKERFPDATFEELVDLSNWVFEFAYDPA